MADLYNFSKGVDIPQWVWMPQLPTVNYHGCANTYDGVRYMYWLVQSGSTSATASTTTLWRFDTWTLGWSLITTTTNGGYGCDVEYDPVRNVLYIAHGANVATWQVWNLNNTSVQIAGTTCAANALTTMAPALPANASYGSSLTLPDDSSANGPIETGEATSGSTATVLYDTTSQSIFGQGMVGLQVRYTSGARSGQSQIIASVQNANQLTTAAFSGAPAVGDTYVIEVPESIASAGTTTTLTAASETFPVNLYSNSDVIITGGTGAGQRRRIASNTATVLTLAAAQAGNANTGPFTTAPDATSTFKIVPSRDFLYFQCGATSAVLYRLDVATGATVVAWSTLASMPATPGGGGNTFFAHAYAPFSLVTFRGNASNTVYQYSLGLNTWQTISVFGTTETFTTGSTAAMLHGKRRIFVQKDSSTKTYAVNLGTGLYEGFSMPPYAAPGAYDGKRARLIKTADGVEFLYLLRPGGQEFFRVATEWL